MSYSYWLRIAFGFKINPKGEILLNLQGTTNYLAATKALWGLQ